MAFPFLQSIWPDAHIGYIVVQILTVDNFRMVKSAGGQQPLAVYVLSALAAIGGFLFGYDTGVSNDDNAYL